jgi:hypothetical protein
LNISYIIYNYSVCISNFALKQNDVLFRYDDCNIKSEVFMNFGATLNNSGWQQSTGNKKTKGVIKMFGSRKNVSALVAILLGVLIVSLAINVKETPQSQAKVYSQMK